MRAHESALVHSFPFIITMLWCDLLSSFLSFFLFELFCCCCCCCDYTQYSWFFSRNLSMRVQETPCHYLFLGRICLHYEIHGIDLIAPINKLFYFESVAHGMVLCMCDLNLNWCPPCTKCVCVCDVFAFSIHVAVLQ